MAFVSSSMLWSLLYNSIVKDLQKSKKPRFKFKLLNKIFRFKDPVVKVYVGDTKLEMFLSQKTPQFYASFETYDRALPRICEAVQKIDGCLAVIDIGANIGDTASLIAEKVCGASILCIEGNDKYLPFLYRNTKTIKNNNIIVEPFFCVDIIDNNQFNVESRNGTAHLSLSNTGTLENVDTLDNIIGRNKDFKETNLLKIDTDGFEMMVINGGKNLLKEKHPMVFFEFTPEVYIANGQNPMDLIEILKSFGYNQALFYDNFGVPVEICEFNDDLRIKKMIDKIDKNKIYYYDILCIHTKDESKYFSVLEKELNCVNNICRKTALNKR